VPERREGAFDAAFVAVGAHVSKRVETPAMDAGPIVDAVSFPRGVASGERREIGRRVAIYGGGNTAMAAARTARRLGAEETLIVYRRPREQMPAHDEEARDAEREGVRINWLRTIKNSEGPDLNVEVMELEDSGVPQPTGRFETPAAADVDRSAARKVRCALAATTGVEGPVDVAKYLLAGADVVMTASALLRHGPEHATVLLDGLSAWMALEP
jgi:NADPH-dependent glutamate synthase beta subunit-like oxidoreductase